jgi:hypothetical protein
MTRKKALTCGGLPLYDALERTIDAKKTLIPYHNGVGRYFVYSPVAYQLPTVGAVGKNEYRRAFDYSGT